MRANTAAGPSRWSVALRALLLAAALLPAALFAQERRVRVFRDTTRDSTVFRVMVSSDGIEKLIHELMASKAMEQTIGMSLREAAAGQASDPKRVRELSEELGRIAQKNAALITSIEMTCSSERQPEGYIGVQFSELQTTMGDDAPMTMMLREYPRIDSVYSASPASKAGVHRGDMVLLIGGMDARRPVQLDKLLRPMSKLPMRVQRDGAQKDLTIVVEKKPTDFNSECVSAEQVIGPDFDQPMIYMRTPRGAPRAPGGTLPRTPMPAMAPDVPMPPMMPPAQAFTFGFSTMNQAIGGMTLMALDDDWRATLGVDNGVLVIKVQPGTPAKDAGLRNGDVIVSAEGQSVASVRSLQRVVSNAKSAAVKLQIIRAGKPLALMFRWQEQPPNN